VNSKRSRSTKTAEPAAAGDNPAKPRAAAKGSCSDVYKLEFNELAYRFALLGASDQEIAAAFHVSEAVLNHWRSEHPDFDESLQRGKDTADATVADQLFRRATGYSHPDFISSSYQGEVTLTETTKYYPPDVSAAIFWLKNRQREKWGDVQRHEHTGKDGNPMEALGASVADLHAELQRRGAILPLCGVVPVKQKPA
jgi:hypothetical protein